MVLWLRVSQAGSTVQPGPSSPGLLRAGHLHAHSCGCWQVSEVSSFSHGALHRAAHKMACGRDRKERVREKGGERERNMNENGLVFCN